MGRRFYICDVFSDRPFGGNPLAVLPEAAGLSATRMQQIAAEFGFSETTFVLPAEAGQTCRVRIFSPTSEIPFAGHPNLGTACVLAHSGRLGGRSEVVFEEEAGLVRIRIEATPGRATRCELTAPEPLCMGEVLAVERMAAAVGLRAEEIVTSIHPPRVASVGLPFLFAQVRDVEVLARARANLTVLEEIRGDGLPHAIHLHVREGDRRDLRARVFVPLGGVPEDPATGSANCALAALLSQLDSARDGEFCYRIRQGIEMGRPSTVLATAIKRAGTVVESRVAGDVAIVAEGEIDAG